MSCTMDGSSTFCNSNSRNYREMNRNGTIKRHSPSYTDHYLAECKAYIQMKLRTQPPSSVELLLVSLDLHLKVVQHAQ